MTKAARRDAQRRRDHSGAAIGGASTQSSEVIDMVTDLGQIEPFEIEEL